MTTNRNRSTWRHPLALVVLAEALYLSYFHVVASAPSATTLFSWLPFGGWRATSPAGAALLYTLCLGALFLLYGWLLGDLSRRAVKPGDAFMVFGGAALFSLTLVFLPALMSKDLYDLIGHGRVLTVHGANPFITPASEFPPDQFTQAMGQASATPLYGPAWASIGAALTMAGGGSLVRTVVVFKLFFAAVHLINGLLVMTVAGRWRESAGGPWPLRAAAFYLWNPLVLTQAVGNAHNDGVVLLWILLGVWMLQRRDDITGAAGAAMSVMIKYIMAPVVMLLAIQRWRETGTRRALLFVFICAAVAVLACAPYLRGFDATRLPGWMIPGAGTNGSALAGVTLAVHLLAAAILGLWFLSACWKVETLGEAVEAATRLLLFYLLFVTTPLRSSHIVWIVGLAAVVAAVPLRRAVALFSCTALALEVARIYGLLLPSGPPSAGIARLLASAVAVGVPILYLLLRFRRWPWGENPAES